MVRQITWSNEALDDLGEIKDYISAQSPADALADFPFSHRVVPEWGDDERRETFVHKWRLMFRNLPDSIRIVAVIHGAHLLHNIDGHSFEDPPQQDYVAS